MAKNILVIGGNRFFGRHLVWELIKKGHKPVLFNRQNMDDGFSTQVERIKGDRDYYDDMKQAATYKPWDFVFDQVCFTASQAKKAISHFEGHVGRYIVTSSQSVYDYGVNLGEMSFDPYNHKFTQEADRMMDYAEAKRQMESVFYQNAQFPVLAVRFPIVLGKDDYTKRLTWHFDRLRDGKSVFFPNIKARMGFVDSKEAGKILSQLTLVDWVRPLNVASPEVLTMQELMQMIEKEMGKNFKYDSQEGNDNRSPFGIQNDWFMNLQQLEKLGIKISSLSSWLPQLLSHEARPKT